MFPNINLPTDNFYKFCCLSGLFLIVTSVICSIYTYKSSLNAEIKHSTDIQILELKQKQKLPLSMQEKVLLQNSKELLSITKSDKHYALRWIVYLFILGLFLFTYGFICWYMKIQRYEDAIIRFQEQKEKSEVEKLDLENQILKSKLSINNQSETNNASNSNDEV